MNKPIRILYIDDSPIDRELVCDALEKESGGFELVTPVSRASFFDALAHGDVDIVLSDFNILGFDGLQLLEVIHAQNANLPVIIVTGTGSEEIAVDALKRGASEYVIKTPAHIQRLPQTIYTVLEKKRLAEERMQAEAALRASEKMLHEAQLIAGLGSYRLEIATGLWKSSKVMDDLFGIDETYERSVAGWAALIHPADRQEMVDYFANEVLGRRIRFDKEYRIIRHKDKAERWVHGLGELEIDDQNRILGMYGTIQDITERKQSEAVLAYQSSLIENISDAIISTDLDFTIRTWNQAAETIYGWKAVDVVGKSFPQVVTTEYPNNDRSQIVREFLATGFWKGEVIQKRRDGTRLNILSAASVIHDSAENRTGMVVVNRDITEYKRSDEARREVEAQLEFALQMSHTGGWYLDLVDHTAHRTLEHDQIFGYESLLPEWTYEMFLDHVLPEDRAAVDRLFGAAIAARTDWNFECRIRRPDGEIRWIRAVGRHQHDDGGRLQRMAGIVQDITERKRAEEALRKSEAELRALFASMQDAVLVIARDGVYRNVVRTNPAFWYIPPEEVIGRKIRDFFSAEQSALFYRVIQQVLDTKQTAQIEYEITIGSQSVWYSASISPMEEDTTLWVARDITERKQAEEALRKSEERFRRAILGAPFPIVLHAEDGEVVAINTTWTKLTGYEHGDIPTIADWIQKAYGTKNELMRSVIDGLYTLDEPQDDGEYTITTRSGELRTWDFSSAPIGQLPDGRRLIVSIAMDITERKQAENELYETNKAIAAQASQFQTILDTLPEGVLLLNAEGRVLLANPVALQDLAVLTSQETNAPIVHLGNRPLAELLAPPPVQGVWHTVQVETRTFEIIARPVSDTPEARLWVLVINDVTREREQQNYQQAQAQLATVGQLAAGIAHDFNNIMGVIVLHVSMLRNASGLSARQQHQLDTINDQAQHAANLIRQILDFSRRSVLEKTALDMLPLVKEMVKLLERTLPESIRLKLTYDRSEYIVNGDPTRLQQALMNLVFNARDAMPGGGEITMTCAALLLSSSQTPPLPDMSAGEWFSLSVADTGTGIAPEYLPHIFEPFFTTKEPGKGSGLGLSQVYGIVKQHGGAIDVQTQEGKGATFTIYLPALPDLTLAAPAPKSGLVRGNGETILVVEDNQVMRMALVDILEFLNYQVRETSNGREALAVLEQQAGEIDLVLSDLVMPEMGGQALLQAMRERGLHLPLVVLSGHPLTNEMQAMQAQGLAGWLLKPPNMEELTVLLARTLGQRAGL